MALIRGRKLPQVRKHAHEVIHQLTSPFSQMFPSKSMFLLQEHGTAQSEDTQVQSQYQAKSQRNNFIYRSWCVYTRKMQQIQLSGQICQKFYTGVFIALQYYTYLLGQCIHRFQVLFLALSFATTATLKLLHLLGTFFTKQILSH